MQLLFGVGTLALEYFLRYLLLLYMVPLVFLMMGMRFTGGSLLALFTPAAAFPRRSDKLRLALGKLQASLVLYLMAVLAFMVVYFRADIFRCLVKLF
ncbi:hypothetical protein ACU4GI_33120 [Cupriavidus basilensis]